MVRVIDPEVNPVIETVTEPEREDDELFFDAVMVIELPLVETVIQESLLLVVKLPSVETVTEEDPPSAPKFSEVGATVRYLPS